MNWRANPNVFALCVAAVAAAVLAGCSSDDVSADRFLEVAQRIAHARDRKAPIRAVMLERLGPVVWHRTVAEASAVLEELEETARLWLLTRPAPLSDAQIDELRTHFGAAW